MTNVKFGRAIKHCIFIRPTENQGFLVEVGCKRFSFEGYNSMLTALRAYLKDPDRLERECGDAEEKDQEQETAKHEVRLSRFPTGRDLIEANAKQPCGQGSTRGHCRGPDQDSGGDERSADEEVYND